MRSDSRKSEEREDWRVEPVERRILPLVRALNSRPFRTLSSCQGHVDRSSQPFVIFSAPVAAASALAERVRVLGDAGRLSYRWEVEGSFDSASRLAFSVRAQSRELDGTWAGLWHYVVLRRVRIDADIATLARETEELACRLGRNGHGECGCGFLAPPPPVAPEGIGLAALEARAVKAAGNGKDADHAG